MFRKFCISFFTVVTLFLFLIPSPLNMALPSPPNLISQRHLNQKVPPSQWVDGTAELDKLRGEVTQRIMSESELQTLGRMNSAGKLLAFNVGDQHTFTTYNFSTGNEEDLDATLRAVGPHTYVWLVNNQNIVTSTLEAVRDEFETIYTATTGYFGDPPDVDQDARIHILLFDIQDGHDPITNPVFIAGYFDRGDQSGQNRMDMFYMDSVQGNVGSQNFYGTLAHEFQHMIHFNYDSNEDTWVNEGLSDLSVVLNNYGIPTSHVDAFRPEKSLTDWSSDQQYVLANYGASYLFMEYLTELVDRNGQTIQSFTRALVSENENGIEGINSILPTFLPSDQDTFEEIFEMWLITNYVNANTGDYRYTRGGLENFKVDIKDDGDSDGFTDKLQTDNQQFEREDESVLEWAADYWVFQVDTNVAYVQALIDGENNWWPWGNLDNPSYSMIVIGSSGNLQDVMNSQDVDHTYTFHNADSSTVTLAIVIGSRSGGVDKKGDYDIKVEAAEASPNILVPTQVAPDLVGSISATYKTWIEVEVKTSNNTFITGLDSASFDVEIGGRSATVLTARELTDKYVLEIQPPTQTTEGTFDLEVTAFGNTDTESQAIQYSSLAQNNVDAMLVIDRSGSMSGTPIENALNSAKFFIDHSLNIDDMVGVASYSSYSQVDFPLTPITSSLVKDNARLAVDGISSGGQTSIGAGLQDGRDELTSKGNTNHPWSIVLLSDGQENTSPYVADILPSIVSTKIKVFAIGLGSADEALMQDIAYQTGGNYYYTPSDAELIAIYDSISGQIAGRQTLYKVSDAVQQGQTSVQIVTVDQTVQEAIFSLSWNNANSNLDLTLTTPSGNTIDPQSAQSNPDIEYVSGQTYEYYKVRNPESGDWSAIVYGATASKNSRSISKSSDVSAGEAYNLSAQGVTNLTINTVFDKASYQAGDPINLQVSLSDNAPIQDAVVTLRIQRPDTNVDTLILYDDGQHADGVANDGVYGNFYARTRVSGSYGFNINASGQSSSGDQFTRVFDLSVAVVSASDSDWDGMPDNWENAVGLNSSINDAYEDTDADDLVNLYEYQNGSDPFTWDTDRDSLSDGQEVNTYGTNPTNEDTDLGGVDDATELQDGTNPLNPNDDGIRFIYLPLVLKSYGGSSNVLSGTVTDDGYPVSGTELLLRYYDGSAWSTYATTTTDSSGKYQFTNLPNLDTDQYLYVRWSNTNYDSSRLSTWGCWSITSSTTDPSAYQCNFDLENVVLVSPSNGASVSLPHTFYWNTRGITTDDYEFNIADISDYDPYGYISLGYIGSYTLNGLPTGFSLGEEYGWWMWVYGPDGYGISYYYRNVTFSSTSKISIQDIPTFTLISKDGIEAIAPPQAK